MEPVLIITVLSFLLIFGALLYMITHFLVTKFEDVHIRKSDRALWIWRATILLVVIFVSAILFVNSDKIILGIIQNQAPLVISLLIFFVALIEIAVIDLLLPHLIAMWKRILIETVIFIVLVVVSTAIFGIMSLFYIVP